MQQQHEKIRRKRDYSTFDQDFVRFPDPRSIAPGSRVNYRDTGAHNIFPDPLFKEQWYLVSRVCVDLLLFHIRVEAVYAWLRMLDEVWWRLGSRLRCF